MLQKKEESTESQQITKTLPSISKKEMVLQLTSYWLHFKFDCQNPMIFDKAKNNSSFYFLLFRF